ncbi:MAG: glycosyltransferase family 4 protein [Prolixibacteraceae bacterium]|nr:glycosyltransferase family 4 protein [Prolixibacteraceae bacterium]
MKVLWITNSPFPEVYTKFGDKPPVTAGWIYSAATALFEQAGNLNFAVASFYKVREFTEFEIEGITYFLVPEKFKFKQNSKGEIYWRMIKEKFNPDIIHIHGSEYFHSQSFVNACGSDNVVLSVQGLVSVIARYYFGYISMLDLLKTVTPRDIVRMDTVFAKKRNLENRGEKEKLLLKKVKHIIGRTSWDRDHTWAINPDAHYHFCNETLRPAFYKHQWKIEECERHTLFISQAQYPLKGFHQMIKALSIVVKHYPDTKVFVAGRNYFSNVGIRINGFGRYINNLIRKYKLSDHIFFIGFLTEEEMCKRFISSHVSVCPSAIENSPNFVGEAQLLGVPCIASYVGGTPDMIEHGETGLLYRFEEVEMLASSICKLFSDDILAQKISEKGKIAAAKRHDKKQNAARLFQIYSTITEQS